MTWVASRPQGRELGYQVRDHAGGRLIGWVKFDQVEGRWDSYCAVMGCKGHAATFGRKPDAIEQVAEHYAIEHRR